MKKPLFLFLGSLAVIALLCFFYPKEVITGEGFVFTGKAYVDYNCFGMGSYRSVSDETILTCYGIPYRTFLKI